MDTECEQMAVMSEKAQLPSATPEARPVNVALIGFGTVGSSVARILSSVPSHLHLTHIINRNVERKRAAEAATRDWHRTRSW